MRRLLVGVFLSLLPLTANAGTLEQAVVKLIIDVHNLKEQVRNLQVEVDKLKERLGKYEYKELPSQLEPSTKRERESRQPSPSTNVKVDVLKGSLIPSKKTCLLATVLRVREDGVRYLKNILPKDAPLYVRKWGKYKVFLTLPQYCSVVKKYIKDAKVVDIEVNGGSTGKGTEGSKFYGKQESDTNG